jgi:DNA-damage-inducible protein J
MSPTTQATPKSTMIHVRVDEGVKARASEALAKMGLSVSEAVRVLLVRVVSEQAFPFAIEVPNAQTRAAMESRDLAGPFATGEDLFDALDAGSR